MKEIISFLAFVLVGMSLTSCHQTLRENKWTAQDSIYSDYYTPPQSTYLDQNYYHSD